MFTFFREHIVSRYLKDLYFVLRASIIDSPFLPHFSVHHDLSIMTCPPYNCTFTSIWDYLLLILIPTAFFTLTAGALIVIWAYSWYKWPSVQDMTARTKARAEATKAKAAEQFFGKSVDEAQG